MRLLFLMMAACTVVAQQVDFNAIAHKPTISVTGSPYFAVADGTGTGGTDQSSKFQAAVNAISLSGGGSVVIPYAHLCYVIGTTPVIVPSNVTIYRDSQATCVQKQFGNHPW